MKTAGHQATLFEAGLCAAMLGGGFDIARAATFEAVAISQREGIAITTLRLPASRSSGAL